MQGWKMRDMKMWDQFARVENAGKVSMESQSMKKCLKVVVFVCRVIPSVKVYLINDVKRNYTGYSDKIIILYDAIYGSTQTHKYEKNLNKSVQHT